MQVDPIYFCLLSLFPLSPSLLAVFVRRLLSPYVLPCHIHIHRELSTYSCLVRFVYKYQMISMTMNIPIAFKVIVINRGERERESFPIIDLGKNLDTLLPRDDQECRMFAFKRRLKTTTFVLRHG